MVNKKEYVICLGCGNKFEINERYPEEIEVEECWKCAKDNSLRCLHHIKKKVPTLDDCWRCGYKTHCFNRLSIGGVK